MPDLQQLEQQARLAMGELLQRGRVQNGQLVVAGCSTSEVAGQRMGTAGNMDIARALLRGFIAAAHTCGAQLAVQGCEHINRSLVLPRSIMLAERYEEVCVLPHEHAGGALCTAYYEYLRDPCTVRAVQAQAGLDVGGVLIGMQIKPVAVPLRLENRHIGHARIAAAWSRPPLIGGERARYPQIRQGTY